MNPPFGTRKKGADMEFLSAAMKVKGEKENLFHCFLNFRLHISSTFCYLGGLSSCLFLA